MAESLNHINTETYKLLKEKLSNLKDNIQEARNLNKITLNDSVYDKNFEDDDNKYSTLKRVCIEIFMKLIEPIYVKLLFR